MKKLFNDIQNKLASIKNCLHLHFEFSVFISYVTSKCINLILDKYSSAAVGAIISFTIGILKEVLLDKLWRGEQIDVDDIKADLIGSITGALASLI